MEHSHIHSEPWWTKWSPENVTIADDSVSEAWKYCTLQGVYFGENEYNGNLGARISSIFVILVTSSALTLFPLIAKKVSWLRVHKYVYLFARSFGTGVILATAFIHLMDPAYQEIGGFSCVAQVGNWSLYSWCPAIMLTTVYFTFLVDLFGGVYVERKYGIAHSEDHDHAMDAVIAPHVHDDSHLHNMNKETVDDSSLSKKDSVDVSVRSSQDTLEKVISFKSEFSAFLVLEFGVLFHSVMIGLNLGTTGDEFSTLYPVLVFHQAFEGLGIGARLSAIDFPHNKRWWPYVLCMAYGLTTPIAIAIGLGVRKSYQSNSYAVNVVSGVLDAISAGILLYTGLVELLARDFLFNRQRAKTLRELIFNLFCLSWGVGLMALLGKWA
ncbi:hypothetical protein ZYGR_0R00930 [Zygosaccharomyces rouxii]|uniref:ZYRO0F02200p n=2 Tax=Zygosaccharomyces rouxii TaxID=4956 RepID=C5DX48_ZYGRC|nr:uncharacterized protein ZYRO0F02200g [Zygosaccharomyces rouxii]KAH9199122.1 Zinc/iron permease [Zygosaccharomyces rouxii]GAV49850.1 hypothetical protein ZYGR_0R00930 [Zygosaccharomyces rouxii]CAR28359.1 ZYRO0F02200p [Zygosaccharomyces rouxii]